MAWLMHDLEPVFHRAPAAGGMVSPWQNHLSSLPFLVEFQTSYGRGVAVVYERGSVRGHSQLIGRLSRVESSSTVAGHAISPESTDSTDARRETQKRGTQNERTQVSTIHITECHYTCSLAL